MSKINQIVVLALFALFFYGCKAHVRTNETCKEKFTMAQSLALANFNRQSALDSALHLANECMDCDSIRKEVVDFKIRLLVSMKRYAGGIAFVDSLKESDFTFGYKQRFILKGIQALEYNSKKDTAKRNLMYKEMENDIDHYVKDRTISDTEFKEIYTDLFAVKERYLNASQINEEIEFLKRKYPEKQSFLDFFKK
jgi:hypothetical protein